MPGTFAHNPDAGVVLDAGPQTLSVTFTPTDTINYTAATTTVQLTVNKATLTVTASSPTVVYGSAVPTITASYSGLQNGDGLSAPALSVSGIGTPGNVAAGFIGWALSDNAANTSVAGNDPTLPAVLVGNNTSAVASTVDGIPAFHLTNGEYLSVAVPKMQAAALANLWTKHPRNPVLTNPQTAEVTYGQLVRNPAGGWYFFAPTGMGIYRWESSDLISSSAGTLTLAPAASGAWDYQVQVASVFQKVSDGSWVMLYRGSSADGNYHMGEATSSDGSLPFVRKNNGGVNDGLFNAFGANYDPTSVMLVGSRYYVYMNGSPSHGDQNIYYSDDDFATFTAAPNNPIFGDTGSFCAGVWADGAYYYMLIPRDVTPGGVALYDHGIGLWRSTSPLFTAASREFLGYAAINDQTYDAHYMDTPSVPMMDVHKSAYAPELGSMLYAMYSGSNGTAVTQSLIGINRTGLASLQKAIDLRTMLGNEMAFSLWVQFDQLNAGDPVISVGESATDGYPKWLVNIAKSGGYRFAIFLGGAFQATNVALTTGTPYNLVVTTDDVNTYAYVNGVLAGIFSQRNINAEYTISNLYVGTSFPGTNHLHGYVWDLRVYPEMLSASRVAGIYGVMTTAPTCSTTYTSTTKVNATPPTTSCSGGAVSSNYTLSYVSGTVTITQAAPSITWASSAAITYGTAVGATQLNANSTVAGTFVYTPTAGTVLNVGSQTLSVTFTPNDTTDYSAATATVALTVNQATPSITWANPAAITYGTALGATQLNASSTVAGTFVYTPTAGTVLNAGSQTLSVTLTPTDTIDNSTATKAVNLVVNKATPIEVVTPSSSSITTAQALNVTVAVNPSSGNPTPTGTVTLSGGGYTASPVTLAGGGYIFTVPANSLAVGTDTLTVNYSGDSNYASIAGTASVNVTAIPIVKVTPATTTLGAGDVLNVTAAVTGSGVMPTGTVTLSGGGYTSSASTLSSGSYIFAIPANSLSVGTDTLTVSYSGNSNYAAATGLASVTVMQSVLSLAATTPAGVAAGEGATSTVTVSAITSYAGTVTITCALTSSPNGATQLPTCSNGSSTVTLTDTTTTGTATVTVGTTAPTTIAMSRPGPGAGRGWVGAGGGAILAFLVFFGIPGRQRNWRSLVGMLVVMVALGSIAGCGGGGGRSRSVGTTVPATTAGTYTFTVTATGSPSVTPTPIATFTLTVN